MWTAEYHPIPHFRYQRQFTKQVIKDFVVTHERRQYFVPQYLGEMTYVAVQSFPVMYRLCFAEFGKMRLKHWYNSIAVLEYKDFDSVICQNG
ncbi:hypothetical protein AF72_13435 [Xylella taiwanensis]|uniref:Uncharacterized protein n=1 Tax=Xylella taiwanensis TaxID=1444770 RepID=Z9JFJ4_9GAMM|nr:hypothetical protein AB672_02120 [Xylella taiwanensis]EWS76954.1 hypothetical protein AF72_13435 [Xylella taiwanensis]